MEAGERTAAGAVKMRLSFAAMVFRSRQSSTDSTGTGRGRPLARAVLLVAAFAVIAGLAKVVVDSAPKPELREKYARDGLMGGGKQDTQEYVLMSEDEKSGMLKELLDGHGKPDPAH
ncbi:MAG: hypothetical protein C3L25_12010 [Candidatus Sedimenticola endophacoides]|nr:MAG: hypothetical protein B0D89_08470 [Candidatus Sedimenticola endophacoides]PUD98545.1 MAG: hypothetical protein C3L26_12100 [Candidatus Sedimenticola endophacoides]PUE01667.1 MAG: hypothetical protein C3L25_12010 [Candidatus Sedimenticola endophacoides]